MTRVDSFCRITAPNNPKQYGVLNRIFRKPQPSIALYKKEAAPEYNSYDALKQLTSLPVKETVGTEGKN